MQHTIIYTACHGLVVIFLKESFYSGFGLKVLYSIVFIKKKNQYSYNHVCINSEQIKKILSNSSIFFKFIFVFFIPKNKF